MRSNLGTMSFRRRITNFTGAPVSRLRFRIIDITTFPVPTAGVADLRALTSGHRRDSQTSRAPPCETRRGAGVAAVQRDLGCGSLPPRARCEHHVQFFSSFRRTAPTASHHAESLPNRLGRLTVAGVSQSASTTKGRR